MRRFVLEQMRKGRYPNEASRLVARTRIKKALVKQKGMYVSAPKDFYKDAGRYVKILITGESLATDARFSMLQLAIQLLGTNPAILTHKVARTAFIRLLELGGLSPHELGVIEEQASLEDGEGGIPLPPGGSVASPREVAPAPVEAPV